jgi:hypothetical protein
MNSTAIRPTFSTSNVLGRKYIPVGGDTGPGKASAFDLREGGGEFHMRRVSTVLVLVLAVMGLTMESAIASTSGAHFFSATAAVNGNGALVVTWDEAGLGNENIDYTLTADSTAVYACINNGGNHPKASNKESVNGSVSTGGSFQAKNGRVKASLTAGPLTDPSFTCPSGQTRILAKVAYTNIVLTDTSNDVTANPADVCRSFSTLFPC